MAVGATLEMHSDVFKVRKAIESKMKKALVKAATKLKREAQKLTPVDLGNLKASADISEAYYNNGGTIVVYYTAEYAVYVHEDVDAFHRVGRAKFLEDAANYTKGDIDRIFQRELKV